MQKNSDQQHRLNKGIPLLFVIIIGLLFFSAYMATERLALHALPSVAVAAGFLISYALVCAVFYLFFLIKERKERSDQIMMESLNAKMHNVFKCMVDLPYAITDENGRIRAVNTALQTLLGAKTPFYRGIIADITGGVSLWDIRDAATRNVAKRTSIQSLTQEAIERAEEDRPPEAHPGEVGKDGLTVTLAGGGRYVARAYKIALTDRNNYLITFTDVTEFCALQEKNDRDMPAVAYIDVDNLEELTQYTRVNYRDASRKVDDVLVRFAASVDGFLREYDRDRYLLFFSQAKLRECEENKFADLLEGVREIRLGEYGIPVTVSVGISISDATMAERAADASSALDMALQRGGDQVAVRRRDGIHYYGGHTRPFQRRTKAQSHVIASYLLSKISESDNLLVMGHKNPDFDSIGSCVGLAQLGLFAGVPTKIIVDMNNQNFKIAAERLTGSRTTGELFISADKGLDLIRPNTLLVICDANNFGIIESPDVATNVRQVSGRIAIIDHHRQTGEYDFDPLINYIDTSASSASELVTEILEDTESRAHSENSKLVSDEVASVILSGIVLDTGNFTKNTGSRTLDAARYLYSKGANAERVHSFFDENFDDYVRERSFANCTLLQNGSVGVIWSNGTGNGPDDRVAASKEADKLLAIKGIHASFALVAIDDAVHISGRSDGEINVQLILERLGGGGRFDSAGAAVKDVSVETAKDDLTEAINAYFAELQDKNQ